MDPVVVKAIDHVRRRIGAAVIDDQNFKILKGLVQHAAYCSGQQLRTIESRNDNAYLSHESSSDLRRAAAVKLPVSVGLKARRFHRRSRYVSLATHSLASISCGAPLTALRQKSSGQELCPAKLILLVSYQSVQIKIAKRQ
jgi:hypothetical protein